MDTPAQQRQRTANEDAWRDDLEPLPLFSKRSARIVATIDGMLGLVRHDDQGNARISAWG